MERTEGRRWGRSLFGHLPRITLSAGVFGGVFLTAAGNQVPSHALFPLQLGTVSGFVTTMVLAMVAASAVWWSNRRRWPLLVVAILAWIVFASWTALCAASYVAATTLKKRLPAYVVLAGSLIVAPPLLSATRNVFDVLGTAALVIAFPVAIGLWVNARRDVQAERAEQARARERERIAREMHDVVAHRVSLMVLHAGAIEVNARDETIAAEAALIHRTGREALTQLREVLGVLRSPQSGPEAVLVPQPSLGDLDRLLDESRAAGLGISRTDEGTPREVPVMVGHTAYRVVQEGLTNVHKHAGSARAEVVLHHDPSALRITVRNEAPLSPGEPLPGSGLGLIGLRERVALLGGELTAGPRPDGGFELSARLPLS